MFCAAELCNVIAAEEIGKVFAGFQKHLYQHQR
jgi:hypothetical protein